MAYSITCAHCGTLASVHQPTMRHCSAKCRDEAKYGPTRYCRICSRSIPRSTRYGKIDYCSRTCRIAGRPVPRDPDPLTRRYGITPTNLGACSELRVCVDLMTRGFYVFRAEAANGPCDLIAMTKDGTLYRVEVKTGYLVKGKLRAAPAKANQVFDVLAVATTDSVTYIPPWE